MIAIWHEGRAELDSRFQALKAGANEVVLDTAIGHIRRLAVATGDRIITPLHTAPWADEPIDPQSKTPAAELGLSGDFLCAPFCVSDIDAAPLHGWPANSPWRPDAASRDASFAEATFVLERPVMGATVRKTLRLVAGQPFLYLAHAFDGGAGRIPISHHAMIRATETVRLSFSPKIEFFTPDNPVETDPARGRSLLRYPSQGADLSSVPLGGGGEADIRTYPFADGHEDVIALIDAPGGALGWSAAVREAEDDIVLLIKNSRLLPQTMLWMSNGGRHYPPWRSRHTRVLGIEDGCSFGPNGHRRSIEPNRLSARGIPTAIDLDANPAIPYAIGAVPRPAGWTEVSSIAVTDGGLTLTDVSGEQLSVPFNAAWLGLNA